VRQSEFRKKVKEATEPELESMLKQEREGLYKLRQQLALKQLDNPHAIKMARKNVARILTEMRLRRAGQSGR
jgi:ribosomal protein L29